MIYCYELAVVLWYTNIGVPVLVIANIGVPCNLLLNVAYVLTFF